MNESIFHQIGVSARCLHMDFDEQELAQFTAEQILRNFLNFFNRKQY